MWIQTFDGDLVNGEFVERIEQSYGITDSETGLADLKLYAVMGGVRVLLDDSSTLGSPRSQDDIQNYIENSLDTYLAKLNWKYQ